MLRDRLIIVNNISSKENIRGLGWMKGYLLPMGLWGYMRQKRLGNTELCTRVAVRVDWPRGTSRTMKRVRTGGVPPPHA